MKPCASYLELYSPARRAWSKDPASTSGDYRDSDHQYGSSGLLPDWKAHAHDELYWFRFTREAGIMLSQTFPGFNQCGSRHPMWLKVEEENQIPSTGTGKKMKICKASSHNQDSCYEKEDIAVMDCKGYLVYQLTPIDISRTYCVYIESHNII